MTTSDFLIDPTTVTPNIPFDPMFLTDTELAELGDTIGAESDRRRHLVGSHVAAKLAAMTDDAIAELSEQVDTEIQERADKEIAERVEMAIRRGEGDGFNHRQAIVNRSARLFNLIHLNAPDVIVGRAFDLVARSAKALGFDSHKWPEDMAGGSPAKGAP